MPLLLKSANYFKYAGRFRNQMITITLFLVEKYAKCTGKKLLFPIIFKNRPHFRKFLR